MGTTNAISIQGPGQLVEFFNGEIGFYRSLCALLQKQRDRLVRGEDRSVPADLEEITFLHKQIEAGEALLRRARDEGGEQFAHWLASTEVEEVVKKLTALVGRCRNLTVECARLSEARLDSEPVRSDIEHPQHTENTPH